MAAPKNRHQKRQQQQVNQNQKQVRKNPTELLAKK